MQKIDIYLQLNPMPEEEAIKYVAIHLDGSVREWWHHGMVILGHNQVTSYEEFTEKLIERFDTRDLELQFKELAQLKQWGLVETYISEFQRLAMLVTDISERRLVVLFMDGLSEPLRGWVKGHDPVTLREATKKAHDLAPSSLRRKFQHKNSNMKRDKEKEKKPVHMDAQHKRDKLDNDTLNDL